MRTYIVDDDRDFCRMIERQLQRDQLVACCFQSQADFLTQMPSLEPGCVLLDIDMPEASGLALLRTLARDYPEWPVIIISGTTNVDHAIDAFRSGAIHLLRKPFGREALRHAVQEAAQVAADRRAQGARRREADRLRLTRREQQVLTALADGQQSKVIGHILGISCRTVDMHRANIMTKLRARNSTQAIAIARHLGVI